MCMYSAKYHKYSDWNIKKPFTLGGLLIVIIFFLLCYQAKNGKKGTSDGLMSFSQVKIKHEPTGQKSDRSSSHTCETCGKVG